jgi:predicted choloylglycine hydrolase
MVDERMTRDGWMSMMNDVKRATEKQTQTMPWKSISYIDRRVHQPTNGSKCVMLIQYILENQPNCIVAIACLFDI